MVVVVVFFFFFKQKTAYEIGLGIPAEPLFRSQNRVASNIAKGALTYTDIAGDPVLYGNLPPREISMKRSEERRVGKECKSRRPQVHDKAKQHRGQETRHHLQAL